MNSHLNDRALRDFCEGGLSGDDLLRVDDHLFSCEACRTRALLIRGAGKTIEALRTQIGTPAMHLSDEELQSFVEGRMPADAAEAASTHLTACAMCARQVDELRSWAMPDANRLAHEVSPGTDAPRPSLAGNEPAGPRTERSNWFAGLAAAAAIATVAGGIWEWRRTATIASTTPNQVSATRAQPAAEPPQANAAGAREPQSAPDQSPQPRPVPEAVVSLFLDARTTRSSASSETPAVTLRPQTKEVRIQVDCGDADYPSYRVTVQSVDGTAILSRNGLTASASAAGKTVTISIGADLLLPGDYVLTLGGGARGDESEDLSKALFRVRRP